MSFQSIRLPVRYLLLLCLALPALLAGCGGGGGGASVPPSPFAGRYEGTVTTGNDNVTTNVVFNIDQSGTVSTTFPINGINQTFVGSLGNVDANGNFQTQVSNPVVVNFVGTIKPDPANNGAMTIIGSFNIPSTGLQGTYRLVRVSGP